MSRRINMILAVVLCIGITGISITGQLLLGIANSDRVSAAIKGSEYKELAYEEFEKIYTGLLEESGFSKASVGDVFSERQFTLDLNKEIENTLSGKKSDLKVSRKVSSLQKNLTESLSSVPGVREKARISKLAKDCGMYYSTYVEFPFGKAYSSLISDKIAGIILLLILSIAITVVGAVALIYSGSKKRHSVKPYGAAGILMSLIPQSIWFIVTYRSVNVSDTPKYYQAFIDSVRSLTVAPFALFAGLTLITGIIVIFSQRKKKGKN